MKSEYVYGVGLQAPSGQKSGPLFGLSSSGMVSGGPTMSPFASTVKCVALEVFWLTPHTSRFDATPAPSVPDWPVGKTLVAATRLET